MIPTAYVPRKYHNSVQHYQNTYVYTSRKKAVLSPSPHLTHYTFSINSVTYFSNNTILNCGVQNILTTWWHMVKIKRPCLVPGWTFMEGTGIYVQNQSNVKWYFCCQHFWSQKVLTQMSQIHINTTHECVFQ